MKKKKNNLGLAAHQHSLPYHLSKWYQAKTLRYFPQHISPLENGVHRGCSVGRCQPQVPKDGKFAGTPLCNGQLAGSLPFEVSGCTLECRVR